MKFVRFNNFSKKLICALLSICMFSCFFSTSIVAQAKSESQLRDELENIDDAIADAEQKLKNYKEKNADYVKSLNNQIDAYEQKINLIQKNANSIKSEISNLQSKINKVQAQIDAAEVEIAKIAKEIETKQKEFDASYNEYCQRLRAMYISGSVTNLEVLLTCNDISSMLTRSEMLKSVSEQDSEKLEELMDVMKDIEKSKQKLEKEKAELKTNQESLVSEKENLNKKKQELESNLAEEQSNKSKLDSKMSEYNSVISKYESEIRISEKERDKIEKELQEEIRRKEEEYQNGGNSGGDYTPGSGRLAYPTYSRKLSAGFPRYPSGRYHSGVDFAVPSGTAVHAADNGVVITVKYLNYSYGYHIIISHGNGMQTVYAHNSQLLVKEGQNVKKGQLIAKSGSTGNSTGPHCHFEVRVNGKAVNPMKYLG